MKARLDTAHCKVETTEQAKRSNGPAYPAASSRLIGANRMADPANTQQDSTNKDSFSLWVIPFWIVVIGGLAWYLPNATEGTVPHQAPFVGDGSAGEAHDAHGSDEHASADWLPPVREQLAEAGYDWLVLSQMGDTISVQGEAPSEDAKATAFAAAEAALNAAAEAAHAKAMIVNDITVKIDPDAWTDELVATLNYDWMKLSASGSVATVSGTAPDATTRDTAYSDVEAGIQADAGLADRINLLVNGIVIEGEDAGATDALLELTEAGEDGLTVDECATAFTNTMQGRNIQFAFGSAEISPESARLLDALSGIATLCVNSNGHSVEVGGHTDATGDEGANQLLSEARAMSVRQYLVGKGVDGARVSAIGYGESQLLDTAETEEANAINRRTEFKVVAAE